MQIRYDLVVDFARPTKSNTVMISEGDVNSRACHFVLLNNKVAFSMTDVTAATVRGIKSDGSVIYGDATILEDEFGNKINELEYVLPAVVADLAGDVTMTITLLSTENEQVTSFEFYLKVRNALYNEDDYVSQSDLSGFRDLLNRCLVALERMEAMTENTALPNPFPLNLEIEGEKHIYTGNETVDVTLNNLAYMDEDIVISDEAIDETAAGIAVAAARKAEESANDAAVSMHESEGFADNCLDLKDDCTLLRNDTEALKLSSVQSSLKSEGYSIGTQNGVPVGEGSDYYRNNAKYYKDVASGLIDGVHDVLSDVKEMIAPEWQPRIWNVGEYAIHNNKLYECLSTNNDEPTESSEWHQTTLASIITNIRKE